MLMNELFIFHFLFTVFIYRSSRLQMFYKADVVKNFAKFTGKHLCRSPAFNKSF